MLDKQPVTENRTQTGCNLFLALLLTAIIVIAFMVSK